MAKISTICINCNVEFFRFPAFHRHAEKRGSVIKCCSKICTNQAISKGLIICKPRKGVNLVCEVCNSDFYRSQYYVNEGKSRFCSEPCRIKAHEQNLIDRTGLRPNRNLGETIKCMFCNESVYRKKSMIERNINKTCGKTECMSAYLRSLWDLPPKPAGSLPKKKTQRINNFTAAQRKRMLKTSCEFCGSIKNLCLDHIVAVCRGGTNADDNAQTLCQPCNIKKSQTTDKVSNKRD